MVKPEPGEGIRLRPALPADEPFLRAVYASTRADEMAMVPWTPEQKQAFVEMQFRAQDTDYRRNYPEAAFLVIEREGVPIGRLYVDRRPASIHVLDIALLARSCNGGVGTKLLRDLQAEAASLAQPLTIHVERFNPALRLYQRLGFHLLREEGDVYLLMEWRASA